MGADIFRRCGCRDETGKQLGTRCPKLASSKHGSWGFYISAGVDPLTGKRAQVRESGFRTQKEAQKAHNEVAVKLDRGAYIAPTRELYGTYLTRWLEQHRTTGRGLKESTMVNYRRYVELDIAPSALGRISLTEVRRFHVNGFIQSLVDAGRGATTIRRVAAVVQGSLRSAAEENLIDHNPAAGIKLPRVEKKEFEAWEPEQVGLFLDVASAHRLGPLFELAMFTGMRRGELVGLRWSDVDPTRRQLTVRNNRVQAGKVVVDNAPKTKAGRRTLDLDDRSVGALISWRFAQRAEAESWDDAYVASGYVFTYEDGRPLLPQYASRLFESCGSRRVSRS